MWQQKNFFFVVWNPSIILTNTFGVYQGMIIAMTVWPMVTGNHKFHRKFWRILAETMLYKMAINGTAKKNYATLYDLLLCLEF